MGEGAVGGLDFVGSHPFCEATEQKRDGEASASNDRPPPKQVGITHYPTVLWFGLHRYGPPIHYRTSRRVANESGELLRAGGVAFPRQHQKVLLGRRRDYGGAAVCRTPSSVRDWPARCQDRPTTCGTFKQSGEQVAITRNGSTRTVKINAAEGGKAI